MEDLPARVPWAACFMLDCMRDYPVLDSDSDTLREYYPIALSGLSRYCGAESAVRNLLIARMF